MYYKYQYPLDALMKWNGNHITDHNRAPVGVSYEKIMTEKRMVNGRLRRLVTAEKKTFKVDWKEVFTNSDYLVDDAWGFEEIRDFYINTPGDFELTITDGTGNVESVIVVFKDFSYTLSQRGRKTDLVDLTLSLEEV